jgi:gag-polypeptide of LTR copia-type
MANLSSVLTLPKLPTLEIYGNNWLIFADRFIIHITGQGYSDHLDQDNYPAEAPEEPSRDNSSTDSEHEKKHEAWKKELQKWKTTNKQWLQEDAKGMAQLAGYILPSIFLEARSQKMFFDMWEYICLRFQETTHAQKADLQRQLNDLSVSENGDIQAHLMKMEGIVQTLASGGVKLPDDEYCDAILRSLPLSYQIAIDTLETTLAVSKISISPAMLKNHLIRTYEMSKSMTG